MDTETVLKMVVDVMVNGSGNFDELREKLNEVKESTDDAADSTKELTEADTAYVPASMSAGDASEKAGKSALGSSAHHRELRMALNELNRVIPGLGHVVYMLEEGWSRSAKAADEAKVSTEGLAAGMDTEAAAADTAAAANESFILSAGPIAILLLSITALVKAWDYYKEGVKAAQEEQTKFFTKLDEDSKKALETWQKLQDALHPKPEATKKYTDEIERDNAVLDEKEKKEAEVR